MELRLLHRKKDNWQKRKHENFTVTWLKRQVFQAWEFFFFDDYNEKYELINFKIFPLFIKNLWVDLLQLIHFFLKCSICWIYITAIAQWLATNFTDKFFSLDALLEWFCTKLTNINKKEQWNDITRFLFIPFSKVSTTIW